MSDNSVSALVAFAEKVAAAWAPPEPGAPAPAFELALVQHFDSHMASRPDFAAAVHTWLEELGERLGAVGLGIRSVEDALHQESYRLDVLVRIGPGAGSVPLSLARFSGEDAYPGFLEAYAP